MTSSKTNTLFRRPLRNDAGLNLALALLAALGVVLLLIIIGFLARESAMVLQRVGLARLVSDPGWYPIEDSFGLLPMLVASVVSALGAVAVATPLGLGTAVYCRFYSGERLGSLLRHGLGVCAGMPSVVFGFWGLTVLVPWIAAWRPPGASLLAGVVVLSMMILPTIALTSHAALAAVPQTLLAAGHALGLRRSSIVRQVVLVAARSGIGAGVVMALGRALGETMAMLMVSGNIVALPHSVFDPVRSLAANIALEMAYAMDLHRSALFACGIALVTIVGLLTLVSARLSGAGGHA